MMKKHINDIPTILYTLLGVLLAATSLCACQDELLNNPDDIPQGDVELEAVLSYIPMAEIVDDQSGSRASILNNSSAPERLQMLQLNKLTILFYDTERKLVTTGGISGPVTFTSDMTPRPSNTNVGQTTAESSTPQATFKRTIPSGRYYVFAVANKDINLADVPTIDALRSLKLTWVPNSITQNLEMLGVFTLGDAGSAKNIGFEEDNLMTLRPGHATIHAWGRRAVSKVTIDFDGSQLRNNVTVYIRSARIVDIADGCYLGKTSKVGEEDGEFGTTTSVHKLVYGTGDVNNYRNWPSVSRGSGKYESFKATDPDTNQETVFKFHGERSPCLPCYENMQGKGGSKLQDADMDGKIDHPNFKDPTSADTAFVKDGMPHGTWLEVEGYYVSNNSDYISKGPIFYRFMLGKNETDNYDVERSHHYKVTMAFKGNGNDVDWHVDYTERTPFVYASDVYSSYGYNEKLTIPVRIVGGKVHKLKARIIENNWHPITNVDGNTYFENTTSYGYANLYPANQAYFSNVADGTKNLGNGFLTLYENSDAVIKLPTQYTNSNYESFLYNQWYWHGAFDKGVTPKVQDPDKKNYYFQYNQDFTGTAISNPASKLGLYGTCIGYREYEGGQEYQVNGQTETMMYIDAYTRPKNLIKQTGYSGGNIYETGNRIARIELIATVDIDGDLQDTEPVIVTVEQSRRITNPTAIYRKAGNNTPFHVNLKVADKEPNSEANMNVGKYEPIKSRGPWRAVIENIGTPNLISLSKYWGDTDSEIDFMVNFNGSSDKDDDTPKFAIISIYYHDYTCHHRIFVRQGYGPSAVVPGGVKWHACNVSYRTGGKLYEVDDPTDEGSLFRYGNLSYAISPRTNGTYGFNQAASGNLTIKEQTYYDSRTWSNITGPASSIKYNSNYLPQYSLLQVFYDGKGTAKSTYADLKKADDDILADKTLKTLPATFDDFYALYSNSNIDYAYGVVYGDDATETAESMRKAYGHSSERSQTTGYGMQCVIVYNRTDARHVMFPIGSSGYGHRHYSNGALRYAGRNALMASGLAESRPVFWNIMYSKGAIYWLAHPDFKMQLTNGSGTTTYATAWDMNYTSFDFYSYGTDATSTNTNNTSEYRSDAAFIRLVTRD